MAGNVFYNIAKERLLTSVSGIRWDDGNVKIMLVSGAYSADADHNYVASPGPAISEMSGTGYSRKVLSCTITKDTASDVARAKASSVTWSGINAGISTGAVIYYNTGSDATSPLICYLDGGFPVTTNGGDITISFDSTNGIFYF